MMTDRFYTTPTQIEKVRAVWERGVMVAEKRGDLYKTQLYQLPRFYLEVVWHSHFNVVIRVNKFSDLDQLTPYLDDICIADLMS